MNYPRFFRIALFALIPMVVGCTPGRPRPGPHAFHPCSFGNPGAAARRNQISGGFAVDRAESPGPCRRFRPPIPLASKLR